MESNFIERFLELLGKISLLISNKTLYNILSLENNQGQGNAMGADAKRSYNHQPDIHSYATSICITL